MTTLIITRLEDGALAGGWLVAEGNVPIGVITGAGAVCTPSGAEYTVREGRLWPATGPAVAGYEDSAAPRIVDAATGTAWELKPGWRGDAFRPGPEGSWTLDVGAALARPYTLEDAQATMPARIKLLLAHLALQAPSAPSSARGDVVKETT